MRDLHVWPNEKRLRDGQVTVSAAVEMPDGQRQDLWYSADEKWEDAVTEHADCCAIATIFLAMKSGLPLFIHGRVSSSLLENLEEFQAIWHCWKPDTYRQVDLRAEVEREAEPAATDSAISCYSGGVDGAFTALRHSHHDPGRRSRHLGAGLLIQGFDIPLVAQEQFSRNLCAAERTLGSLHLPVISMKTNWRSLPINWEDGFAAAMASCQHSFSRGFSCGLLGSSEPYSFLSPWGSNPLTDPLLSSKAFRVIHDGAEFNRIEKVRQLASWQECQANLRVCWEGKAFDRNCGRCEKCIRTILNFRVVGAGLPSCFDADVTDEMIASVPIRNTPQRNEFQTIIDEAKASGMENDRWVRALRKRVAQYDRESRGGSFAHRIRKRVALRTRLKRAWRTVFPAAHRIGPADSPGREGSG